MLSFGAVLEPRIDELGDRHDAVGVGRVLAAVVIVEVVDQRLDLAALSAAPVKLSVAVVPTSATLTVRPLFAVTMNLPLVSATVEPSIDSTSLAPSVTLVTRDRHRGEGLAGLDGRGGDGAEQVGAAVALGEGRIVARRGQRRLVVDRS